MWQVLDSTELAVVSMLVVIGFSAADPRDKPEDDDVGAHTPGSYAIALVDHRMSGQ